MKMKLAIVMAGIIFFSACSSSFSIHPPHESVKGQPPEVHRLHDRMARLIQAWYWKKDQRAFWQLISRQGPLNRISDEHIFFDAFTKPVDEVFLGNREMSAGPMSHYWKDASDAKRLNPRHRAFAIVEMSISRDSPYNPDVPPRGGLFVFYAIQGEGFATKALRLTWVQENDIWMIWDITELEIVPQEEASLPPLFLLVHSFGVCK